MKTMRGQKSYHCGEKMAERSEAKSAKRSFASNIFFI